MPPPPLERTWTAADVMADLSAALAIVDELEPSDDLRVPLFQFAVQLVTQRAMRQPSLAFGGLPLDGMGRPQ